MVHVVVRDNDVERASRMLKRALQNDGFFRRMRLLRHHEKASERRLRKKEESVRRMRRLAKRSRSY